MSETNTYDKRNKIVSTKHWLEANAFLTRTSRKYNLFGVYLGARIKYDFFIESRITNARGFYKSPENGLSEKKTISNSDLIRHLGLMNFDYKERAFCLHQEAYQMLFNKIFEVDKRNKEAKHLGKIVLEKLDIIKENIKKERFKKLIGNLYLK